MENKLEQGPFDPAPSKTFGRMGVMILEGVDINNGLTDVAQFTGLPSKYIVDSIKGYDASTGLGLSLATVGIFNAPNGIGAIVALATLTTLTLLNKVKDMILGSTDVQNSPTLYVRNGIANGSPATISVMLRYIDLTP